MNIRWRILRLRLTRRPWFRSTLYGAFAVATALIGAAAKDLIPDHLATQIGASAVGNILGILASSMLAITTFSLSTMVAAYASASSNATPPAPTLLIEDSGAQKALATFIGASLFSIVGLIALSTGVYGDSGRLILFGATVLIIVMIVVTLLRWIDQLSRLGRVSETIDRAKSATRVAMQSMAKAPRLHAKPFEQPPASVVSIESRHIGYVTYINAGRLQALAEEEDLQVWPAARQKSEPEEIEHDRLYIHELDKAGYFEDIFAPLARACAGMYEVAEQLLMSLAALGQLGYEPYREPAEKHADRALQFSAQGQVIHSDQLRLRELAQWRTIRS